jgi:hypothetical protein
MALGDQPHAKHKDVDKLDRTEVFQNGRSKRARHVGVYGEPLCATSSSIAPFTLKHSQPTIPVLKKKS